MPTSTSQPDLWILRCRWGTIVVFFLLWIVLSINVPYPQYYVVQHLLTVLAWIVLFFMLHKRWLKEIDFYASVLFLVLHLIGARYIYSLVPYDDWLNSIFGFTLADTFGWKRNHYDRLVHLMYGVLLTIPIWHLLERFFTRSRLSLLLLSVMVILSTSALYELAEWILTEIAAPALAESYNGQQGDMWDPQKDMALALGGSLITAGVLMLTPSNLKKSESTTT
ncbi:MAG: DUF2238 domain-containing protein [Planctomycetaceae bacterium]